MYQIIQKRKIWLGFSGVLMILSIVSLFIWRLNFGIDFTGGALLEIQFDGDRPSSEAVQEKISDMELGSLILQPVSGKGLIFRFQDTSEEKHQEVLKRMGELVQKNDAAETESPVAENDIEINLDMQGTTSLEIGEDGALLAGEAKKGTGVEELRYDSVGPSIGQELKRKSITAVFIVIIAIVAYIAWAFRKVSKPVESWKFGLAAIIALFHDVIITLGVFSVLGYIYNIEVNIAFVAAILTVLGYSVNDTIVVFDRIRENLPKSDDDFEGTVNSAINQTISRSVNTSLTTLLVLLSILFFGGETIRDFVLALSIGVTVGTYSSIFLASPILVLWEKARQ